MAAGPIWCGDLAARGLRRSRYSIYQAAAEDAVAFLVDDDPDAKLIFERVALNFDQMRALAAEGIPLADVSTNRKDTRSQA